MSPLCLVLLAAGLADAEPAAAPTGPPPQLAFLKASGGKVTRTVVEAVPVIEKRKIAVNEGGMVVEREVTVTVLKTVMKEMVMNLDKATITTAGGKKLTAKEAVKAIGDGAVVVLSSTGAAVDKAYLKALKADTLVIVGPMAKLMPMPMPKIDPIPLPPRD